MNECYDENDCNFVDKYDVCMDVENDNNFFDKFDVLLNDERDEKKIMEYEICANYFNRNELLNEACFINNDTKCFKNKDFIRECIKIDKSKIITGQKPDKLSLIHI